MLLWTIFALMTGAAALAVLWPLAQHRPRPEGPVPDRGDVAVYKDQLDEIGRDRERGLIPPAEAEAARIEVSRRLAAPDASRQKEAEASALGRRRAAAIAILVIVPAVGLGVYGRLGSPDKPDEPLAARLAVPPDGASV